MKSLENHIKIKNISFLKTNEELKNIFYQLKNISLNKNFESYEKYIDIMIISKEKKYSDEWDIRNEYNELNNKTINELNDNFQYKKYEEILNNYLENENNKIKCIIF